MQVEDQLYRFCSVTGREWFKPWPGYQQFTGVVEQLSRLHAVLPATALSALLLHSRLLAKLVALLPPEFAARKVVPLLESGLTEESGGLGVVVAALARQDSPALKARAGEILCSWVLHLASRGRPCQAVRTAVRSVEKGWPGLPTT